MITTRPQCPWLVDGIVRGQQRNLVALANRNAIYYLLDRATGAFVSARPYAKFTWTKGIDDSGRPDLNSSMEPSESGTLVWPSMYGATNWFSPSYSPMTKLVYISVREQGSYFSRARLSIRKAPRLLEVVNARSAAPKRLERFVPWTP